MPESRVHDARSGFLEKSQLQKLRLRAMRAGVWFRSLPRIDRVLVDLTIKVAGSVRSFTLAENILAVVRKLEGVMESRFLRAVWSVDAEMTIFGTFMILLCVVNYFAPFWAFSVPSTLVTTVIAQVTCFGTLLLLGLVGVGLAFVARPFRLRNVFWLPFIYAYWGFQSFIAMFALFEILLRRKKQWRKTEHTGRVTRTVEGQVLVGVQD